MAAKTLYKEELRIIGHTLESKGISVFEITCLPERYVIHAVPNPSGSASKKLLGFLRSASNSDTYSFTLTSVEIIRHAELAKPSTSESLDNFRRASNVLGTVGAYLDLKQAELFEIKLRPISLSLWYRDRTGHEQQEDRAVSSFYNLFIELQRKSLDSSWQ
ncbi:MAG TPA: hypothetical protein VGH22_12090 [Candidatus Binatia bacterium]